MMDIYDLRLSLRLTGRRLLKEAVKLPKHLRSRQIDVVIANFCDVLNFKEINQIIATDNPTFPERRR